MAIAFRQAVLVATGNRPTSRDWNRLANAANDRIDSGLGNPNWRLWWRTYALVRKVRKNAGPLITANDEWFSHYAHLDPRAVPDETWGDPIGQEGGANPANPMMMYLFGLDGSDPPFFDEGGRLSGVTDHLASTTDGPGAKWEAGKAQRGAYDPATGALEAPAIEGAADYRRIVDFTLPPFLQRYGGWFATPAPDGACAGGNPRGVFVFTPVRAGLPTRSWDNCPPNGLASIYYGEDYYFIRLLDGSSVTLFYSDYVEGPYTGPAQLKKTPGDQLLHALGHFASDFRGSAAQRATDRYRVRRVAADFQDFATGQYPLAPSIGVSDGVEIEAVYPKLIFDATLTALNVGALANGVHTFAPGFVFAGYYAKTFNLAGTAGVELFDVNQPTVVFDRFTLGAAGERVQWFRDAVTPTLGARLTAPLELGARVEIECAELLGYKPGIPDAALVMRCASSKGEDPGAIDGNGRDFPGARAAMSALLTHGCIVNDAGAVPDQKMHGVPQNPVYDAARDMIVSRLRLLKREQLRSYEVVGGKAVLRFTRHVNLGGKLLDLFAGLAPPKEPVPSGQIGHRVRYIVRGGDVIYLGQTYHDGETFVGLFNVADYEKAAESIQVFQYEGILNTAPQHGLTNEWQLFLSTSPFNHSELPLDAYNDAYNMLFSRAHFASQEIDPVGQNTELFGHFQPFAGTLPPLQLLNPEAPDALNYVTGSTRPCNWLIGFPPALKAGYFSSNRVHVPDYEVESVLSLNHDTEVQVTLTAQLHHLPGDPAPRCDDNAVTDYLDWRTRAATDSLANCPRRLGDQAGAGGDNFVGGCCVPRFYFTQKVRRVWTDTPEDNDLLEPEDTRMLAHEMRWLDFRLGAMCEGYLDRDPPLEGVQPESNCLRPPNYTYERLCLRAFGQRWVAFFPPQARPDNPKGHGPFANTRIYAETFNRLVRAVNLLTEVLVEVPLELESRQVRTFGRMELTGDVAPLVLNYVPPPANCPPGVGEPSNFLLFPGLRLLLSLDADHPPAVSGFQPPGTTEADFTGPWEPGLVRFKADTGADGSSAVFTDTDPLPLSLDHFTAIEFVINSNGDFWHFVHCNGTDWVFMFLAGNTRGELRLAAGSVVANCLPAGLLELLGTRGFAQLKVSRREKWLTEDASGVYPFCAQGGVWPEPDVKVLTNRLSELECRQFALRPGFFDGTAPLRLDAPPVRPSLYWQTSDGNAICNDGAGSSLEPISFDYLSVSVPVID